MPKFFPNLYIINYTRQFKAVCISKNAGSSIKWLVLSDDYPGEARKRADLKMSAHYFFADDDDGKTMVPVGKPKFRSFYGFAICRDPVERAMSLYNHQVWNPPIARAYFKEKDIINCSPGAFIEFVETELKKSDPLEMDEHVRPQSMFYNPDSHVDEIVPIGMLDEFMKDRFGVEKMERLNRSGGENPPPFTDSQRDRLKAAYEMDYDILSEYLK